MVLNPYPEGVKPTVRHESFASAQQEAGRVTTAILALPNATEAPNGPQTALSASRSDLDLARSVPTAGSQTKCVGAPQTTGEGALGVTNEPYLQFPICLLRYSADDSKTLAAIYAYSLVNFGMKFDTDTPQLEGRIRYLAESGSDPGFDRDNPVHVATRLAASTWKQPVDDPLDEVEERYNEAFGFICDEEDKAGKACPQARVKLAFYLDVANHGRMTMREFRVFAGLVSCLGCAKYKRVTKETILARAQGHRSSRGLQENTALYLPQTVRQVGLTLDALHARHFFARVRISPRKTVYSIRQGEDQIRMQVWRRASDRAELKARKRREDREFWAMMKDVNA